MAAKRGRPPKGTAAAEHSAGGGGGDAAGSGGEGPEAGALAALPAKQQTAVLALLEHTTIKSAAAACGVTDRTLYRWMAEGDFKRAFREARREAFGHSVSLAQRYTPIAVGTLVKLAGNPKTPPAVRASARVAIVKIGRGGKRARRARRPRGEPGGRGRGERQRGGRGGEEQTPMIRLTGRVRSLERRTGPAGPCRTCAGRGHGDAVLEVDGRPLRQPRGCLSCGRLSDVKRIILSSGGDPKIAARFRAAWPPPGAAGGRT